MTGPDDLSPSGLLGRLAPEDALRRLELTIVRRLEGFLRGEHLGLLPGPGTELAEARAYRPGEDDVRHMDWAVTARTVEPHVRDVVADRELETWALVDLTPSMDFGTAAREKRDLAVAAVATVGVLTQRVGDRFGGYVLRGQRLRRWPARSGRLALYGLLRSLVQEPRSEAPGSEAPASGPHQTLDGALAALASGQPRRGLRVVVSDFMEPGGGELSWERGVRRLAVRHQVLAVEVRDPRESQLPDVGVVQLVDPESGRLLEVDTSRRATREAFSAAAIRRQEQVASALRRAGAAHLILSTDSDWVVDTARFVLGHRRTAHALHRPRFTVS
ncbi:MAG TPA: DUF58 domain-containing protein [Actinomycetales bacterium]|nr:DUF58 domain-containing protein [Actinomycetales bacterium]